MENQSFRGGRPRLSEEERSDRILKVRFTEAEYRLLLERKATTNLPDLSKFIRSLCLDKPLPLKPKVDTYQTVALSVLREIRADLLRIGVNVNQSARRINATTDYVDLRHEVGQIAQKITGFDDRVEQLVKAILPTSNPYEQDDSPNQ